MGGGGLDRPFKCDQCPQSFNRNHDLKRHKRIHLAVKPYPCGECEKSFSRKDALKVRLAAPFFISSPFLFYAPFPKSSLRPCPFNCCCGAPWVDSC